MAAGASGRHVLDDPLANLPASLDAVVLEAVGVDDGLAAVQLEEDRLAAQRTFGKGHLELGGTHLEAQAQHADFANEAFGGVGLGDLAAVHVVSEVAVRVAADTRIRLPEGVHQVVLAPEPAVDAAFNLPAVLHRDDMAFGGQDRQAQLAAPGQVLHVHLVLPTPAPGVRAVVGIPDGQAHTVGASGQKALGPGHVGGGLDGDAHIDQGLQALLPGDHEGDVSRFVEVKPPVVDHVGQLDELGIVLGERVGVLVFFGDEFFFFLGLLDVRVADLEGWFDALGTQ